MLHIVKRVRYNYNYIVQTSNRTIELTLIYFVVKIIQDVNILIFLKDISILSLRYAIYNIMIGYTLIVFEV